MNLFYSNSEKTRFQAIFRWATVILLMFFSSSTNARVVELAPDIPDYQLECDDVFACPAIIDRRVDFWINVFQKWKKQNRVLHDSRQPERVYIVLDTEDECRRKNPKGEVKSAINTVKKQIDSLVSLLSLIHISSPRDS